jgi:DNA (cytosine-5)-methyltransferase 1
MPFYAVDLFSGCGGLSQGFHDAGWKHVFAVEKLSAPSQSFAANFHCPVWSDDVAKFVDALRNGHLVVPRVNAVIGGPPCQGFSPLGKMSANGERLAHHSALNRLWMDFVATVEILQPEVTLTENVPEFLGSVEFADYEARMRHLGYNLDIGVLNAVEYGVPQRRKRAFCIGSRLGPIRLPQPTNERMTVRQAIGSLPLRPDGRNWHIGRNPTPKSLERYRVIPPGGNRFDLMEHRPDITPKCWLKKKTGTTDVFGRLEWDGVALTIRTEFFKPEKGCYLHPQAHRPITHREAASLQTFPDNFVFRGTKTQVARQIGEAVPPKLAHAIANEMNLHLAQHGLQPL